MKKTAIIYASRHHGNTEKLVAAIAERYEITLIDAEVQHYADLTPYDLIGFASGIDFGKFYDSVENFLKENLPENKKVFFLYTCARKNEKFTKAMGEEACRKGAVLMGEHGCKGFNTYGPWKIIGGMNKGHPNGEELEGAASFYREVLAAAEEMAKK